MVFFSQLMGKDPVGEASPAGWPAISTLAQYAGRSEVRRALYMPAVCAIVHNEVLRKVYRHLTIDLRKPKKVAITAVMRKLSIHMDRVCAALPLAEATVAGE
jgi:hypothetical protein